MRVDAEPHHLDALLKFAARAYRRPLTQAERDDLLAYYHSLREKDGSDARRRDPRLDRQRADVAELLLPHRSAATARPALRAAPIQAAACTHRWRARRGPAAVRLRAGQPAELLPLVEHARRGAAGPRRRRRPAQARRADWPRPAACCRTTAPAAWPLEFGGNWLDFRRFEEHNASTASAFPSFTNELREAMFEEPVRFFVDVIRNDRSVLDLLYGNYTFVNPVLARHYGMPEVTGGADTLGPRRRRAPLRPRRPAADGGLPDAERARPADQPGEARLLGGPPRARRDDPAAAADRPRAAARRGEARTCRCATCWPGTAPTRSAPAATRASTRSAWRSKATARSARRATKDLAGRPVDTGATFPGGSAGRRLRGRRKPTSASTARTISSTTSAASCWPTPWAARCMLSDEPVDRAHAKPGWRRTATASAPLVETIVTSPQFLNKRRPDSAVRQKGE